MEGLGRTATIILQPEGVRIPGVLRDLESFRQWARSAGFPEKGRIDWIGGEVEVDMSPENLYTHGTPKVAIARALGSLVEDSDLGVVFVDATRVTAVAADLSSEPDVVVVFFESIDAGRVRHGPAASGEPGQYVEIEGAPDLVVECVSDSSETKDCELLRERYFRAGIREYWLVDARREAPKLTLLRAGADGYVEAARDADGFVVSPRLGVAVRLVRLPPQSGVVRYRLETRPA